MRKTAINNRIIWIILVFFLWYILVPGIFYEYLFDPDYGALGGPYDKVTYMHDAVIFTSWMYLSTLPAFILAFLYTGLLKRNRFIFRTFLPGYNGTKTWKLLAQGLAVGFIMNFACIAAALVNGDIKLVLDFSLDQIPFYLFAFLCVFIQSSSEELWCRGFLYERINVHYPLWVSILVNGTLFGLIHMGNPGVTTLAIVDIALCGISYSLAKWYTGSIWFPFGLHTAWNFTQNYLFGLPNSGLVSEVSIFKLDAMNARSSWVYDASFGVEGAIPAVVFDVLLGVICLILAYRDGRLGELKMTIEKRNTDGVPAQEPAAS